MNEPAESFAIALTVPAAARPVFERAIGTLTEAVATFEEGDAWRVTGYARALPEAGKLQTLLLLAASVTGIAPPEPKVTPLSPKDWVREAARQRPPVRAGRFFVFGAHDRGLAPVGTLAFEIEAGLAFGTGAHATTKTMLLLLDRFTRRRRFQRPLDLGTGSGILALAMAAALKVPVLATDSDPTALKIARRHGRANGLSPLLRLVESDGFASRELRAAAPFDLMAANLFARPLCALANDMAKHAAPGAILLLSGLLTAQAPKVFQRYRAAGFVLLGRHRMGEWATLALQKGGPCKDV